jgi:hypothetical protein
MKYFLSFLFTFIAAGAIAQSNFKDGYIINHRGDTLKGFINYKYRQQTAETIEFKNAPTSTEIKILKPDDIKAFYVSPGTTCLSYSGRLSINKNHYPDNDVEKDTTTITGSVFLQQLLTGANASLFTNTDQIKTRYFYQEKNTKPVELTYYEFASAGQQLTTIRSFVAQLTILFNKYNGYNNNKLDLLQNVKFTQGDLENAFQIINANQVTYQNKHITESGFFIGGSIVRTHSTVNNIIGATPNISSINYSPKINVGYDVYTSPTNNFLFRGALSFSYLNPSYSFAYTDAGSNNVPGNVYSFSVTTISVTPQAIYNFYHTNNLKVFVGAGVSFNFSSYKSDQLKFMQITSFSPYTVRQNITYNNFAYPAFQPTFPIEAGVTLNKHVEISLSYCFPVSIQSATTFTPSSMGAGINYLFK